jgi:hypothetical protein
MGNFLIGAGLYVVIVALCVRPFIPQRVEERVFLSYVLAFASAAVLGAVGLVAFVLMMVRYG